MLVFSFFFIRAFDNETNFPRTCEKYLTSVMSFCRVHMIIQPRSSAYTDVLWDTRGKRRWEQDYVRSTVCVHTCASGMLCQRCNVCTIYHWMSATRVKISLNGKFFFDVSVFNGSLSSLRERVCFAVKSARCASCSFNFQHKDCLSFMHHLNHLLE